MKKRVLTLLLILSLLLCGCEAMVEESVLGAYDDDKDSEQAVKMTDISMLYYPDMDTDPLTTDCFANHELSKLVYCPLIRIDESFKPYCVLAESYVEDGSSVTVTLKDGLLFSDGSAVRADDIEKSIDTILKNPASPYYSSASKLDKYYDTDDKTFYCTFKNADIDCAALLDFPVTKDGKGEIGCGPYIFSEANGKPVLRINENYFEKPSVPLIKLVETANDEYITSLFSAGELDIISVEDGGSSLASLRDYPQISSPSNTLIYIGINISKEQFAGASVRRAISTLIDRKTIAEQSLVNLAEATVYPFNPSWYKMDVYNIDCAPSVTASEQSQALEKLTGMEFTLTIPKGSEVKNTVAVDITEGFKQLGIFVTLVELEAEEYITAVTTGDFDMYLGETSISRTMDPTYLYKTGGLLNYAGYSNSLLDAAFEGYKSGELGLDRYLDEFAAEMPIIPIIFRKNVMYSAKGISGYSKLSAWNRLGDFTTVTLN